MSCLPCFKQSAQSFLQDIPHIWTPQTPKELSAYIKKQSVTAAAQAQKAHKPNEILTKYCQHMEFLCFRCKESLNHIHVSAVVYGTAKVCNAAIQGQNLKHHDTLQLHQLHSFLYRMLFRLQYFLPRIQPRQASSILWSCASLGVNPDSLIPGIVDELAQQFLRNMSSADGQSFASLLLACVQLRLDPRDGHMCYAMLKYLNRTNLSAFDAQAVANTAWALQELRYAPQDDLALAMASRLLYHCQYSQAEIRPQHISNLLFAFAELRLPAEPTQLNALVTFLLSRAKVDAQDLTTQRGV